MYKVYNNNYIDDKVFVYVGNKYLFCGPDGDKVVYIVRKTIEPNKYHAIDFDGISLVVDKKDLKKADGLTVKICNKKENIFIEGTLVKADIFPDNSDSVFYRLYAIYNVINGVGGFTILNLNDKRSLKDHYKQILKELNRFNVDLENNITILACDYNIMSRDWEFVKSDEEVTV